MKKKLLSGILINIALLAATCIWVLSQAMPASEATRLRNALLAQVGNPGDFTWNPGEPPSSYKQEKLQADSKLRNIYSQIIQTNSISFSNFQNTLYIAKDLLQVNKGKGGGILSNTLESYEQIISEGTGYCADFTQVLNALAYTANIPVREWGMSFDGFGGRGHAFSEIYDKQLNKWIFIDIFNSFYVADTESQNPLSVMEFRHYLRTEQDKQLKVITINKNRFGFKSAEHAIRYYQRGKDQFYMWWGNNILSYENNSLIKFIAPISRHLEQITAIILGIHPEIRIIKTDTNALMIQNLLQLKSNLLIAAISGMLLVIILLLQLIILWKHKHAQ